MTPDEFPKVFAAAFATQDCSALRALLVADAQVVTLTGAVADDAAQAGKVFEQEFSGIFAAAKLVTGRTRMRELGPGLTIVQQRYVVMGAKDDAGAALPRFAAAVTAVLLETAQGWLAVNLTLSHLT